MVVVKSSQNLVHVDCRRKFVETSKTRVHILQPDCIYILGLRVYIYRQGTYISEHFSRGIGMEDCPVCEHPKNISITNEILRGIMTIGEAGNYFNVTRDVMEVHVKEHIRVLPTDSGALVAVERKDMDSIGMLQELIFKLKGLFDKYSKGEDVTTVRSLTALVRELRGCIRIMEELTGKLQTGPMITLHLQQIVINKVQSFLMEEVCPDCRTKVVEYLGKELELQKML